MDPIPFRGALAGASTSAKCLSISSEGDAKLVLEIPASDLANVLRIVALGRVPLRFTVETE